MITKTLEEQGPGADTHWSTQSIGRGDGNEPVGDLADLAGVLPQAPSGGDLEVKHGPAGPGPHGALPADPAHHAGADDPWLCHNGTTSLFAAMDVASGSVIAQHYRRHRATRNSCASSSSSMLPPGGLDLHLVCDNYATHETPEVKKRPLRHPRFQLHFTPMSSSWMNLVERWFAELTNRKLRRTAHRSVTELEPDIRTWINQWNRDPKPFVWTKTADKILDTLAAYCRRINDSGH